MDRNGKHLRFQPRVMIVLMVYSVFKRIETISWANISLL
jgi:hypothetical protein